MTGDDELCRAALGQAATRSNCAARKKDATRIVKQADRDKQQTADTAQMIEASIAADRQKAS